MPIFLRSFSESTKQKKMFYLYAENSICGIITTMIKSDQEYKKNKKKIEIKMSRNWWQVVP